MKEKIKKDARYFFIYHTYSNSIFIVKTRQSLSGQLVTYKYNIFFICISVLLSSSSVKAIILCHVY